MQIRVFQYLFCFYNFLFILLASGILGLGIWLLLDISILEKLTAIDDYPTIVQLFDKTATSREIFGILLIFIGAYLFSLSLIGFIGAVKDSQCLLGTFGFFLSLLLILEIISITLYISFEDKIWNKLNQQLSDKIKTNYSQEMDKNSFTLAMNRVMVKYNCCGIDGFQDFQNQKVPQECFLFECSNPNENQSQGKFLLGQNYNTVLENSIFSNVRVQNCPEPNEENTHKGCFEVVKKLLLSQKIKIWSICIASVVGVLQLIGIIITIVVFRYAYYDYK